MFGELDEHQIEIVEQHLADRANVCAGSDEAFDLQLVNERRDLIAKPPVEFGVALAERALRLLDGDRHCGAPHLLAEINERVVVIFADQRVQGTHDGGGRVVDDRAAGSEHFLDFHRHGGKQDVALVFIVIVEGSDRDLGALGDVLDARAVIADFAKEHGGGVKNPPVPIGFLPCAQSRHLMFPRIMNWFKIEIDLKNEFIQSFFEDAETSVKTMRATA
ncbi:hypothetical protein D9M70_516970 [compost metagenome]